ncbi:hypothetical protein DPEC_G00209180 [Dallia pectoralis]|uniref:Uncharacterized protein n=1 Tax=Dallia pectoralis TaxID=75939 RepID=A0ACC2G526_DALPE|nr:hypothetical protein DPEC_G00209180 [Dallia pectoralis]
MDYGNLEAAWSPWALARGAAGREWPPQKPPTRGHTHRLITVEGPFWALLPKKNRRRPFLEGPHAVALDVGEVLYVVVSTPEHVAHVRAVLRRLQEHQMWSWPVLRTIQELQISIGGRGIPLSLHPWAYYSMTAAEKEHDVGDQELQAYTPQTRRLHISSLCCVRVICK